MFEVLHGGGLSQSAGVIDRLVAKAAQNMRGRSSHEIILFGLGQEFLSF